MAFLYGGFEYLGLTNLGDQIQSIAAEQFLPRVDMRFNRDTLSKINIKDCRKFIIIMNAWFTHQPEHCFPPSKSIYPIFWGFHVTDWNHTWEHVLSPQCINYLKLFEPIGCRDRFTHETLRGKGVRSFYSQCLTLTFPRLKRNRGSWNIIVDVPGPLPSFIEDKAIRVTHQTSPEISNNDKMKQARNLLNLYQHNAKLVVTTKLHCALPCIAMGIPVIFFGNPEDYRISVIRDVGLPINQIPKGLHSMDRLTQIQMIKRAWSEVDWNPRSVFFEAEKRIIIHNFEEFLAKKLSILQECV